MLLVFGKRSTTIRSASWRGFDGNRRARRRVLPVRGRDSAHAYLAVGAVRPDAGRRAGRSTGSSCHVGARVRPPCRLPSWQPWVERCSARAWSGGATARCSPSWLSAGFRSHCSVSLSATGSTSVGGAGRESRLPAARGDGCALGKPDDLSPSADLASQLFPSRTWIELLEPAVHGGSLPIRHAAALVGWSFVFERPPGSAIAATRASGSRDHQIVRSSSSTSPADAGRGFALAPARWTTSAATSGAHAPDAELAQPLEASQTGQFAYALRRPYCANGNAEAGDRHGAAGSLNSSATDNVSAFIDPWGRPKCPPSACAIACPSPIPACSSAREARKAPS